MTKLLIDQNGVAPELGDKFFAKARRGRPTLDEEHLEKGERAKPFMAPPFYI